MKTRRLRRHAAAKRPRGCAVKFTVHFQKTDPWQARLLQAETMAPECSTALNTQRAPAGKPCLDVTDKSFSTAQ